MQTKHLPAELKAAKDSGTFEAVLSMPTMDRDGEVIDAGAFLPLPKKITIDVDHGLSTMKTVGSAEPFYDGDVLKARGTFASTPLAQEVRTLVLEGHVNHMSVAYRAAQYEVDEKDGLPHLRKGELLNAAIVSIPSNREAEILVAKTGARNSAKDLERLQATHDHMVDLGATCSEKHVHAAAPKQVTLDIDGRALGKWLADVNKSADTDTPDAAATAAASGAEVDVARARTTLALALATAELALYS